MTTSKPLNLNSKKETKNKSSVWIHSLKLTKVMKTIFHQKRKESKMSAMKMMLMKSIISCLVPA